MSEIITVGLGLAKNVFQAHGANASGRAVLRRKLRRRDQLSADEALRARGRSGLDLIGGKAQALQDAARSRRVFLFALPERSRECETVWKPCSKSKKYQY